MTNDNEITSQNVERVPHEIVNAEGSVGSCGGADVDVNCEDKLRSGVEIQTLVDVSEESIAKILGGAIISDSAGDELVRVDVVEKMEDGG